MKSHYHINNYLTTLQQLWCRTHEGAFRGIERWMMMLIMSMKLCFPSFWIRHYGDMKGQRARNRLMECYVIGITAILVMILFFGWWEHLIALGFALYTLADLIIYLLGLIVLSNLNHAQPNLRRNLILLAVNLIQIVSAFAIFYLASGSLFYVGSGGAVISGLESLYFSFATFATVGYGDMVVMGKIGYIISIFQMMTSFLFISLVLSSVVSKIEITSED